MNTNDIIFSSFVGTPNPEELQRFKLVQDEQAKHVKRPLPILPVSLSFGKPETHQPIEAMVNHTTLPLNEQSQFFPLTFEMANGQRFLLPYEPLISIKGKNQIIRRNIAKAKAENGALLGGTIKERWSQDDYEITITGALYGEMMTGSVADCFPRKDFEDLRDVLIAAESIRVYCEPLQILGIHYIVIQDFSFPFTKGEYVQAYEIKAYSDKDYKLLLDLND